MRTFTRSAAVGLFATALILTGCGSDDDATTSDTTAAEGSTEAPATAEVEVTDVWARQSPMGTTAGAVYLNITSPVDDALVGASVPDDIAGTVEIHETVMADDSDMSGDMGDDASGEMGDDANDEMGEGDGMGDDVNDDMGGDMGSMTMQEVESVELPAGETVVLEPGGLHIMLLDLVAPLEVGQSFDLTLTLESGAEIVVTAEVREG
jgi:copper(I)-binding protein